MTDRSASPDAIAPAAARALDRDGAQAKAGQ
jgi:hypothetical protein